MRKALVLLLVTLVATLIGNPAVSAGRDNPGSGSVLATAEPGELKIEIHSVPTEVLATAEDLSFEVEGVASTIGGVRFIDMMLVLDTSTSLRKTDPDDYRTTAAVGLINSLSPKSDINIGVIGFNSRNELLQPLTSDRASVVRALQNLKRSGGTNLAAGMTTAVDELMKNGREDSSRVVVLFTDGMSNQKKAREAAQHALSQGIAVQTMLLGENLKGGFLLEEIAAATGGSFVWVLNPAELPEAFLDLRTTGVDNVTLRVNNSEPIPAQMTAGAFNGTVPLTVGDNLIVATATSLDGQTEESTMTVNVRDASCASLAVGALHDGQPTTSLNERAVEIVVDASRSMWAQIDGRSKMDIAKDILHDASVSLSEDLHLALRAYGSASPSEANDCADSALLVGFGAASRAPITSAISQLRPKGQTPIAYALNQAAADFATLDSERSLVLVTDGIESCGGDPVAAARGLKDQGITIHVIGFGFGDTANEDASSLKAIAAASGGQFVVAASADELRSALEETVGTRFRVMQEDAVVARGVLGSRAPMFLPEGDYRVEFDSVPAHEVAFSLDARDELTLMLKKEAGEISMTEYRDLLEPVSCEDAYAAAANAERGFTALTSATGQDGN